MPSFNGFPRKFRIAYGDAPYPKIPTTQTDAPWDSKVATFVVARDGTGDFDKIQAAIDALPARGGVVYIKEGIYKVSSAITISANRISVIGAGKSTKVQADTGYDGNIFTVTGNLDGITIENINIVGSDSGTGDGINFNGTVTECIVRGCWIEDMGGDAIHIATAGQRCLLVENLCYSNGSAGIVISGSTDCIISNNLCYNNGSHGIEITACQFCIVESNHCETNGGTSKNGIYVSTGTSWTNFIGNICKDNTGYGIRVDGVSEIENIITSNQFYSNTVGQVLDNGTRTERGHNIEVS